MNALTPKQNSVPQSSVQQPAPQPLQLPLPPQNVLPNGKPGPANGPGLPQLFAGSTRETSTKAAGSPQRVAMMIMADLGGADLPEVEPRTLHQRQEGHARPRLPTAQSRAAQPRNARGKSQADRAQGKTVSVAGLEFEEEDEERLNLAASDTVSKLRTAGRWSLEQEHREKYDPLERFALLHTAKLHIDKEDLPESEKEKLKTNLNDMLADLWQQHHDEIRKGLKNVEELEAAVDSMGAAANIQPASMRELRFLYGVKGPNSFDSPLSPMNMAKVLLRKFGSNAFGSAFTELRSKMSRQLSTVQPERYTPRFWLSSNDATAFNTVQSTFAIARKLNMDLRQHAKVEPHASDAYTTISVLGMVEAGKAKVHSMVAQVYDTRQADPIVKGRVYQQVAVAVRSLPLPMWPQMQQRIELLDEVQKQVTSARKGLMPANQTLEEKREKEWREALRANRGGDAGHATGAAAAGGAEPLPPGAPRPAPRQKESAETAHARAVPQWGPDTVDLWREAAKARRGAAAG
jgi:hypothetical protein